MNTSVHASGSVPAVQVLGAAVLLQGQAVLDALWLIRAGVRDNRDGITPPPRVRDMLTALEQAGTEVKASASRHGDVANKATLPGFECDRIGSDEAASVLGVTRRSVQRMAPELGARRISRRLMFDLHAIEAAATYRRDNLREESA